MKDVKMETQNSYFDGLAAAGMACDDMDCFDYFKGLADKRRANKARVTMAKDTRMKTMTKTEREIYTAAIRAANKVLPRGQRIALDEAEAGESDTLEPLSAEEAQEIVASLKGRIADEDLAAIENLLVRADSMGADAAFAKRFPNASRVQLGYGLGSRAQRQTSRRVAMDSAGSDDFAKRFPNAAKVKFA
jgi:hypothetical protein